MKNERSNIGVTDKSVSISCVFLQYGNIYFWFPCKELRRVLFVFSLRKELQFNSLLSLTSNKFFEFQKNVIILIPRKYFHGYNGEIIWPQLVEWRLYYIVLVQLVQNLVYMTSYLSVNRGFSCLIWYKWYHFIIVYDWLRSYGHC